MAPKRIDNALIAVDDLEAAKAFYIERGFKLEGETTVEGPLVGLGRHGWQAYISRASLRRVSTPRARTPAIKSSNGVHSPRTADVMAAIWQDVENAGAAARQTALLLYRRRPLFGGQVAEHLGDRDKAFLVLRDILRRAAL